MSVLHIFVAHEFKRMVSKKERCLLPSLIQLCCANVSQDLERQHRATSIVKDTVKINVAKIRYLQLVYKHRDDVTLQGPKKRCLETICLV